MWLIITIAVVIIILWVVYEWRHPLREYWESKEEFDLEVNEHGKLVERKTSVIKQVQ